MHQKRDYISVFPYVRYNSENNYTKKWLKPDELIDIINNLSSDKEGFKNDATSFLIYLMMFSMGECTEEILINFPMEEFVDSTYNNCTNFSFGKNTWFIDTLDQKLIKWV